VSTVWIVVLAVGATTFAIKATGPVLLGKRTLPWHLAGPIALLAPAVLGALVVTQAVGGTRAIVLDARLVGVGAGALAIRLRAPLLVVLVAAAGAAALVRAL
jgi:branched-subunit amino acid transport protein